MDKDFSEESAVIKTISKEINRHVCRREAREKFGFMNRAQDGSLRQLISQDDSICCKANLCFFFFCLFACREDFCYFTLRDRCSGTKAVSPVFIKLLWRLLLILLLSHVIAVDRVVLSYICTKMDYMLLMPAVGNCRSHSCPSTRRGRAL